MDSRLRGKDEGGDGKDEEGPERRRGPERRSGRNDERVWNNKWIWEIKKSYPRPLWLHYYTAHLFLIRGRGLETVLIREEGSGTCGGFCLRYRPSG